MSDSVVLARDGVAATGGAGGAAAAGAGAACAGGGATACGAGGADGVRGTAGGGEPTNGFVELGRGVQASSSKPLLGATSAGDDRVGASGELLEVGRALDGVDV